MYIDKRASKKHVSIEIIVNTMLSNDLTLYKEAKAT
jgi:hypothetical protein